MPAPSALKVGRTQDGYRVLVEGRGTLRESPAVHEFTMQALGEGPGSLVIDLSACDYLDSTFLGCLVDLNKRHGRTRPSRFAVAAPPQVRTRLLSPSRLDTFLNVIGEAPEVIGEDLELAPNLTARADLGRHVMDCHRRLAELGGPQQAAFEQIAERFAMELIARGSGPDTGRSDRDPER
jgi:anti-anti-sigma regulatory factor